jgi:hypothetical protein
MDGHYESVHWDINPVLGDYLLHSTPVPRVIWCLSATGLLFTSLVLVDGNGIRPVSLLINMGCIKAMTETYPHTCKQTVRVRTGPGGSLHGLAGQSCSFNGCSADFRV